MKIVSLNVNNFLGNNDVLDNHKRGGKYRNWNIIKNESNLNRHQRLMEVLDSQNADIIALQEFPIMLGTKECKAFIDSLSENYTLIANTKYDNLEGIYNNTKFSATVMLISKDVHCEIISDEVFKSTPKSEFKSVYEKHHSLRHCTIKINGIIIRTVHVPPKYDDSISYLKDLREFVKQHQDKPLILLGDLNIFKKETNQHDLLDLIKSEGNLRDVWISQGPRYKDETRTFKNNKCYSSTISNVRLDYVLTSNNLISNYNLTIQPILSIQDSIDNDLSDHNMLVLEF